MSTMNAGCDFGSASVGGIGDATSFVAYPSVEHAPFGLGATGREYRVTGAPSVPGAIVFESNRERLGGES
jgi:hypothetical protein